MSDANKSALLLIDHGSRRSEANQLLDEVVATLREKTSDTIIHGAHMELASPDIRAGVEQCVRDGARHIIVVPFMLAPGRHVQEDIPRLVREALQDHVERSFSISAPLGTHPRMIDIVQDLFRTSSEA